jgi:hypothetical protein
MRRTTAVILGLGVLGAATVATPATAQSLNDRVWVQGAAYWADIDSSARVDSIGAVTLGTDIDLESDLALEDKQTLPSFSAGWRITPRLILAGDYYSLDRTGTVSAGREIVFDDATFPVAASITSALNSDIYRLTLGYAFIRNARFEAGAALGLHATNFELSLEGQASVGGAAVSATRRSREFLAPLPTVGLFANWQVAPRVAINGRVDYLSLAYGDYDGGVTNVQVGASYRFSRHVGIGAIYRFVDYNVDIEKDAWTGSLAYQFNGPAIYLEVAF